MAIRERFARVMPGLTLLCSNKMQTKQMASAQQNMRSRQLAVARYSEKGHNAMATRILAEYVLTGSQR